MIEFIKFITLFASIITSIALILYYIFVIHMIYIHVSNDELDDLYEDKVDVFISLLPFGAVFQEAYKFICKFIDQYKQL